MLNRKVYLGSVSAPCPAAHYNCLDARAARGSGSRRTRAFKRRGAAVARPLPLRLGVAARSRYGSRRLAPSAQPRRFGTSAPSVGPRRRGGATRSRSRVSAVLAGPDLIPAVSACMTPGPPVPRLRYRPGRLCRSDAPTVPGA